MGGQYWWNSFSSWFNKCKKTVIEIIKYEIIDSVFYIVQFTIHSDLGRVVQVIRRDFELDQSLALANGSER